MTDEIGRLSALVERAAEEAAAAERAPKTAKANRRKPSRAELEAKLAAANSTYHKEKSAEDVLVFSKLPLSPEDEVAKREATNRRKAAATQLQAAFDALRPAPPKRPAKKRPRNIVLRDHYPTATSKFAQWLWRQVENFEDAEGATGVDLAKLATQSGVSLCKLEYLVESTRAEGDGKAPKYIRGSDGKKHRAPLYPTDEEIDSCIEVCADRGEYFETGLSGANQLVTFLFLLLENKQMSSVELSRATNIPLKTIESWGAHNPKNREEPTLNDLVACFEELGRPLVPACERNASAVFLNEFAALKLTHAGSADMVPNTLRMKTPTKRC